MIIRRTSLPTLHHDSPALGVAQTETTQDSVEFLAPRNDEFRPFGEADFAAPGLIGKVMNWTSRELFTSQTPMSEEEKQQILDKLQPGDVLLTYASHRPNLGHLEYWSTGAHYTHCALYEGYGRIIETLGDEVSRSPLVERLNGPIKVAVVRPPYKSFRDRALVLREAKKMIGTPYDYKFDNSDSSELYCSEFIEVAMKKVDKGLEVPDASFLGQEITAPDAFADMKGAQLIHDGRSNYWSNQRHQWPLYLGAALGAGVGAAVGGPLGAALGCALGFEGSAAGLSLLRA